MLNPDDIRPDDRVLFLGIPAPQVIAGIAARLTSGLLVAMGDPAEVRAARSAARDCENVMFVVRDGDHIPWRDDFFTKVIDLRATTESNG